MHPQGRRLPLCIFRVRTTHKCLALFEGRGHPRSLIFARAICATHASLLPAALASVSFGFVLVRVRARHFSLSTCIGLVTADLAS